MSPPPLWLSLEPRPEHTQLLLSHSGPGTLLKARLAPMPVHAGGMAMLLEALSSWQGVPLCAVVDADAEEVRRCPERWAQMLGEASQSPRVTVEWAFPKQGTLFRERFFDGLGDFSTSRRLMVKAATGQR
jgi:hypothetical protein